MPSIASKKSSMGFPGDKKGLGVCQKSNVICKRSGSHQKNSQLAEDLGPYGLSCKVVSSTSEETSKNNGTVECINDQELIPEKDTQCGEQSILLAIAASTNVTDDTTDSPIDLETIFSPLVNKYEDHNSCRDHDDEEQPLNSAADRGDDNSGCSTDYSTHFAGFRIDNRDNMKTNPSQEYNAADYNLFFDTSEQFFSLPSLDDTLNFNSMYQEAELDSFCSSLLSAADQISPGSHGSDLFSYPELEQTEFLDPLAFFSHLPNLSEVSSTFCPTIFPKEAQNRKPVTLVLDLDETLVHSSLEYCEDADFTFKIFFNMMEQIIYVKKRPHLYTFLNKVAEMFDVAVFTASQRVYAEELLNILDPDGKLISGRAYRESCIFSNGTHTKDLTVLGLDLAKVVIIDNSPQVFRLQVNNGIPIQSWFDDPSDSELLSLIPFLETLAKADDVRPIIAQRFGNKA